MARRVNGGLGQRGKRELHARARAKGRGGIHVVSEGVDGEGWFLYQQKRLMNAFDTLPLQKKRRWGGGEWKRARHQAGGVGP